MFGRNLCKFLRPYLRNRVNTRLMNGWKSLSYCTSVSQGLVNHSQIMKMKIMYPRSSHRYFASLPSHKIIKLPNLSPTMETGTVVSWSKNEGDEVAEGDLLAEIETDKATMSFDASESGFLAKILAPAGSKDIPVGTALCILVEDASTIPAFKDYVAPSDQTTTSDETPKAQSDSFAPVTQSPPIPVAAPPTAVDRPAPAINLAAAAVQPPMGQRVFASPLARRLASQQGIDLAQVAAMKPGTGMHGMLRSTDLTDLQGIGAIKAPTVKTQVGGFSDISVSSLWSTTAKRLTESKQTVPHYYLTADINLDEILRLRTNINENLATLNKKKSPDEQPIKISINDIFIKAIGLACLKVPECNSSWQGEFIRQYKTVDVSVAVATAVGLITPIIFAAETKGLMQINREVLQLVSKAKENKLEAHEFQGGTFTISNLGMFGIDSFSAIINSPQACVLAVGNMKASLLPSDDIVGYKKSHLVSVTLSCDHRVVDGAVGALWLKEFKNIMEYPALMLV